MSSCVGTTHQELCPYVPASLLPSWLGSPLGISHLVSESACSSPVELALLFVAGTLLTQERDVHKG